MLFMAETRLSLENILKKTVNILEESRDEIFEIYENSSKELTNIENEIKMINRELEEVIEEIDSKKKKNRRARLKLMEVSRNVDKFSEKDIKKAYQKAEDSSVEIGVLREKEEQLKKRRSVLEQRLKNVKKTVQKAENLISRVSVVKDYLYGELDNLSAHYDDLQQRREVAMKIIQAQEEERKRVAREIHDGPAQSLANLNFRFDFASKMIEKDLDKAKQELMDLKKIVNSSVKDVRKIIYDLRPMSLDDLGLIPTLKRYIEKFNRQTDLEIDFIFRGEKKALPEGYQVTLFRMIQEALNNINHHAQASGGRVCLEYSKEQINLMISDDGRGFNIEEVEDDRFGLISMKERCQLLDGEFKLNSTPGIGTKIYVKIPLNKGE